eukprot:7345563-Prymnesium_polylepis.2
MVSHGCTPNIQADPFATARALQRRVSPWSLMHFGRLAILALVFVFPLLETADAAAGGGLLFASLETASSTLKDPLLSLTLHDSGQTTGPLPLNRGSTESARLSISAQDNRLILVLATAISSVDSGAGRPVALLSQVRSFIFPTILTRSSGVPPP